jgi:hypothetical protein
MNLTTNVSAIALTAALACLPISPAGAQVNPAAPGGANDAPVQTVVLRGVRDPAIAPYKDVYGMLAGLRKVTDGKVELVIRILSKASGQPVPGLEITLQGDRISEPLTLSPEGFLSVPVSESYVADNAVFLTNQKKGSLNVEMHLVPVLPKTNLTYGDINASIATGRRALAEILPWYIRLFVGKLNQIKLCYPDSKQEITIANGASPRLADREDKNSLDKRPVYCAAFSEKETATAKDTAILAPPGWVALY